MKSQWLHWGNTSVKILSVSRECKPTQNGLSNKGKVQRVGLLSGMAWSSDSNIPKVLVSFSFYSPTTLSSMCQLYNQVSYSGPVETSCVSLGYMCIQNQSLWLQGWAALISFSPRAEQWVTYQTTLDKKWKGVRSLLEGSGEWMLGR